MSFLNKEMVAIIGRKEQEAPVAWETLTEDNALRSVSRATNLLNADVVKYVRTTPQGGVEWQHEFKISPSSCPSSRVQFESDPQVAKHWVAVELPLKSRRKEEHNVEIREGQRFFIPPDQKFLVIEGIDWYSEIGGPAKGEKPMTKYEFYIPLGKR